MDFLPMSLLPQLRTSNRRSEAQVSWISALVVVGAASAVALRYLDSCSDGGENGWFLDHGGLGCFLAPGFNTSATLVAIFLYCASTGTLYHIQHSKRYVDVLLVGSIALGLIVGFATGIRPKNILFHLLPGSALASLVVSVLGPDVETEIGDSAKVVSL